MSTTKKKRAQLLLQREATAGEEALAALGGLDRLLAAALSAVRENRASLDEAAEQYRGLYLSQREVEQMLTRAPGEPALLTRGAGGGDAPELWRDVSRPRRLAELYGLTTFDLDIVLIALAPELDLRYEQIYGFLQDNVTRRRPTVDLALNLLCSDAAARLARRAHFETDSPLVRSGLLRLIPEADAQPAPLLAHSLKLDEPLIRFLIGQKVADARLATFCRLLVLEKQRPHAAQEDELCGVLSELVARAHGSGERLGLYFQGPEGANRRATAESLAAASGRQLLAVDLTRAASASAARDYAQLFRLVLNEARLNDALPYFDGLDALRREEQRAAHLALLEALKEFDGLYILAGSLPNSSEIDDAPQLVTVPFAAPDFATRQDLWLECLSREGMTLDASEVEELAERFRFSRRQIAAAVSDAGLQARLRAARRAHGGGGASQPTMHDLFAAARAQTRHGLSTLAVKIEPKYGWTDIQLPDDSLEQLREICCQARGRETVFGEWGFGRKTSTGRGVNVLFTGPPGTGKTMAAEVVARELRLDLYKIDLSQIVSKYIGETEKNLDRVFREARTSDAILFFDEADALFGKRSEVKDAHDRFANIEIGYLLQKIEEFDGIAVLATNLRQNMDEAFVRRMQFVVEFPFPDEDYRRRIWQTIFPEEVPVGPDVEFDELARSIRLSGGHLKNIALAGAFYAAADGRVVRAEHLTRAAQREYQKLGRKFSKSNPNAES
jgi:SpoVK/Ycf46/Vps4 family AAA+-type ATPase